MSRRPAARLFDVSRLAGPRRSRAIARSGLVIRRGGLVAFPTETVYGLGADGLNEVAVNRIFAAKGRPRDNPLILHVDSPPAVDQLVLDLPGRSRDLMDRFWPGPLTLVLPASRRVPARVRAGLPTVAVRCPDHPVALELIRASGRPLAAPSANVSGRPSPTTADHVIADLGGRVSVVLDAGPTGIGLESTVLDMTSPVPRILRPGGLTREQLEEVLGPLEVAALAPGMPPPSPGLRHRHYAPRARIYLVEGEPALLPRAIADLGRRLQRQGLGVGFLVHDETRALLEDQLVETLGPRGETAGTSRLFSALRALDGRGVDIIVAESPERRGLGLAVSDRLTRAADRLLDAGRPALPDTVLLVCSGNTCRSPMAEAILRALAPDVRVLSAGTGAVPGHPASPGARAAAASRGLSLDGHTSAPITVELVEEADIILAMTRAHRRDIEDRFPSARGKTHVLAELVEAPGGADVDDPFGGDNEMYERAASRIEDLMRRLVEGSGGRT